MLGARIEQDANKRRRHLAYSLNLGIGEDALARFISDGSHDELCSDVGQVARLRARRDFAFKLITLTGADHSQEDFAAELGDLDLPELIRTACT